MKKFIKPILYSLGFIILFTLLFTILNYIGIISGIPLKIFKIITPIISFFTNGYMIGKNSDKKGWLSGLESGGLLLLIIIILSLILKIKFTLKIFIYYLVLLLISIAGSMIGINRKKS